MTAFEADDYPFWFMRLTVRVAAALGLRSWRYGWVVGAVVVALALYAIGLAFAATFGMAMVFLRTPAFALASIGIAWVLASGTQAVRILAAGLSEIKQATLEPGAFHRYVDGALRRASSWRTTLPWAIGLGAMLGTWIVLGLERWHRTGPRPADHGFGAFPVEWHTGPPFVAATVLVIVFATAVTITMATSVELLLRNLPFAWGLQRYRYVPLPGRVRLVLRPLINAYAWASIAWSMGIALFIVLWLGSWSRLTVAIIVGLVLIGLATFVIPCWSFRRVLDASHEEMSEILCKAVEGRSRRGVLDVANVSAIAAANRAVAGDPPPVLTRRGALTYGIAQAAAFAAVVAKGVLRDKVSAVADSRLPPRARAAQHTPRRSGQR